MKLDIFILLFFARLAYSYSVPGCCVKQFPLRHPGEVFESDTETCDGSSVQRNQAVTQMDTEIDELIDSVLYRVQESLLPSPCKGPGWTQVAYLDMRSPCTNCPVSWNETAFEGKRLCSRFIQPYNEPDSHCQGTVFPFHGNSYTQICGRIVGYQYSSMEAFADFQLNQSLSINDRYVDGISVTRGNPRQHVWTFAVGTDELMRANLITCPCIHGLPTDIVTPDFVGEDYFCEAGTNYVTQEGRFYPDDPLWDGEGCGPNSGCCEFNNPPWFLTTLEEPTCDDIEVRICAGNIQEDAPIELVEIYVK